MLNQSGKVVLVVVVLILIGLSVIAGIMIFNPDLQQNSQDYSVASSSDLNKNERVERGETKEYKSKDLKISFHYPREWFLNEEHYFLVLTSYPTVRGGNVYPEDNQIEIAIHKPGGCHETIEENLMDSACGELGDSRNMIVGKEIENLGDIKFYKYQMRYSDGKEQKFYFLEKGKRVLQIDKRPDPSVFEKEFEDIVRSIKFLDS